MVGHLKMTLGAIRQLVLALFPCINIDQTQIEGKIQ